MFKFSSVLPMIMQSESTDCGHACLAMIARYYGHELTLSTMRRRFSGSLKGTTLKRLLEIADEIQLKGRALRASINYLKDSKLPCILHWDLNHFVVLKKITGSKYVVHNPAVGVLTLSHSEVSEHFTGYLLEIAPAADFQPHREKRGINPLRAIKKVPNLISSIYRLISLTLAIEFVSIILPLQLQWTIDQVLAVNDSSLLLVLGVGFTLTTLLQLVLSISRGWIVSWLGADISNRWINDLFTHLLKLPIDFFEKRHLGDVISRFSSARSIQATVTASFVEGAVDGIFGFTTLIILIIYSAKLTIIVAAICFCYLIFRHFAYKEIKKINVERIIYSAKQQTELIESIRGVQTIKLANKHIERGARLSNATIEASVKEMQSQRIAVALVAINKTIFTLQRIVLITFSSILVMNHKMTTGMLVGFVAYSDQFSNKFASLVEKFFEFRLLSIHLDRIADVVLSDIEENLDGTYCGPNPKIQLTVENLGYRYAPGEPWVFRNISFCIEAGESVAIDGPSGCGKTTLAKLLLGLLVPTEGKILIDGIDIKQLGLKRFRSLVSAVLQDDNLFAGSIADNICFFDSSATFEKIAEAAQLAEIHNSIIAMPMGYESLVGDMGSALSGGQRQRILLARALFSSSQILVLDEATSHLDIKTEHQVLTNIQSTKCTRIVVTHRPETIAFCDRTISLFQ